jgi:hypothetical protein
VLLWENPTTPITQDRWQAVAVRSIGTVAVTMKPLQSRAGDAVQRVSRFAWWPVHHTWGGPKGPQGGLEGLFNNPTYGETFSAFTPLRLFPPVGSNITEARFFIPGLNREHSSDRKRFWCCLLRR